MVVFSTLHTDDSLFIQENFIIHLFTLVKRVTQILYSKVCRHFGELYISNMLVSF